MQLDYAAGAGTMALFASQWNAGRTAAVGLPVQSNAIVCSDTNIKQVEIDLSLLDPATVWVTFHIATIVATTATAYVVLHAPSFQPPSLFDGWDKYPIPNLEVYERASVVSSYRVTAMSLLVTNMSPALEQTGSITAAQMPRGTPMQVCGGSNAYVSNMADSYNGPASKGAYLWWSGTDKSDYEYQPVASVVADKPHLCVHVSAPQGSSQEFLVTLTFVIEYTTRLPIIPLLRPKPDSDVFDELMAILDGANGTEFPHAMENPIHVAEAKQWLAQHAPKFVKGAGRLGYKAFKDRDVWLPAAKTLLSLVV
jgi:hypothetical protein